MSVEHSISEAEARVGSRTLDMFVNTCDYMKFLIDEILASNIVIPERTVIASNELTSKLLILMNKLYQQIPLKTTNKHNPALNISNAEVTVSSKSSVQSNVSVCQNTVPSSENITETKPVLKDLNKLSTVKCSEAKQESSVIKEEPLDEKKLPGETESNIYVTDNFEWVNHQFLKNKSENYTFFCIACDKRLIVSEKDDLWSKHISEETHLASINKVFGKIVFISCEQCKFILFGGKAKTLKFYKFHNMNVHGELKTSEPINNSKLEQTCGQPPKNVSRSSSISSVTKEFSSTNSGYQVAKTVAPSQDESHKPPPLDLSRSSSISSMSNKETVSAVSNALKVASTQEPDPLSQGLSSSVSSITSSVSSVPAKPRIRKKKVKPTNSVNENHNTSAQKSVTDGSVSQEVGTQQVCQEFTEKGFNSIIDGIKSYVYTHGVKLNSGFCIPCNNGFESAFAWYDHMVSKHKNANGIEKEISCEKCDIKIFGREIDVKEIYLNSFSHIELDNLIEQMGL